MYFRLARVILYRRREIELLLLLELLAPGDLPGLERGFVREIAPLGAACRIEMPAALGDPLVVRLRLLRPRDDLSAPLLQLLVLGLQGDGLVGRLQVF